MTIRAVARRTFGAFGVVVFSLVASCTSDKPTQLVAGMTTQMQVPKEIQSVGIVVQSGGRLVFCDSYPVADGSVTLPSTLATSASEDPATPVTITVLGFERLDTTFTADCVINIPDVGEDGVSVIRRRRSTHVQNRALYLPMPLKHACADVSCAQGETCLGGVCEPDQVDPLTLVDYSDRLVFGNTNTCFSVSRCLPVQASVPARLVDPSTCEFVLEGPQGPDLPRPVSLNVRILHENFTPEVLDVDDQEGFVIPDPSAPFRFRLARNLCESRYQTGYILDVAATSLCYSKTPLQPLCDDDLQAIITGADSLFGAATCVVGARLRPAESALYVVLDSSRSMADLFGPEGLQQVLDLSLKDPVFERTRVAFQLMPAQAQACTGENPFASPGGARGVTFGPAEDVRSEVAARIGDVSNVLADDPALYLDAVMSPEGAYKALRDLENTAPSTSFNRRALLIIGNRDLWAHCPGGGSPVDLAASALAEGIHTYVVAVSAPAGTDQGGRDPLADGEAIAAAGGTALFDATANEQAGALALQTIVTDLGSCLYDPPEGLAVLPQRDSIVLGYFDPVVRQRREIAYDPTCATVPDSASGWALDSLGRVRVCGSACDALRDTFKAVSALAAQQSRPPPRVPVHVSAPCP